MQSSAIDAIFRHPAIRVKEIIGNLHFVNDSINQELDATDLRILDQLIVGRALLEREIAGVFETSADAWTAAVTEAERLEGITAAARLLRR